MQAPRSPLMAAPDSPPETSDYVDLVSRGRSVMGDWTPSPKSQASIASEGSMVEGDLRRKPCRRARSLLTAHTRTRHRHMQ
jgi:hypothetical protein